MTEHSEQLISLFLQDPLAMSDEQASELSGWITQGTENTKAFIESCLFYRSIHSVLLDSDEERNNILQESMDALNSEAESLFDEELWDALLKEEALAPEVEITPPTPEKKLVTVVKPPRPARKISKTTFIIPLASIAAMVCLLIYVTLVPPTTAVEVATLTNSLNAQWAQPSAPANNTRIATNHSPLMLRKGYAELIFDNNSKLVIEAPAEFQVISYDQIRLEYGRIYATVPGEAMGFVVSTPNSKIIDLGTEFGVHVDVDGNTELHVVKGKTTLVSGSGDDKENSLIRAGMARKITSKSVSPADIFCDKLKFARKIDTENQVVWRGQNLSLADIVGGGNGFGTGQIDKGVDLTGNTTHTLFSLDVRRGPEQFVRASFIPCIDGVFVPGINSGPTQISSLGLETDDFPTTSGLTWGYIFNGAWHESNDTPRHQLQLNGVRLDGVNTQALTMHSNLGMTFDLAAIRKQMPGLDIQSFTSEFGISTTIESTIHSRDFSDWDQGPEAQKLTEQRQPAAEFWVFLDGQKVLQKTVSSGSGPGEIDIPIDSSTRFLTLAVTEADDTVMFDWAVFARPELNLKFAEQQQPAN